MPEAPFTEDFVFTGPHTAISCKVEYDSEGERYIARGSAGWSGFSARSPEAAALNCFTAWLADEGGWYVGMEGQQRA